MVGGDLRAVSQTDVLAKETCDKKDNDCDGKVDEDNVCGGGGKKDGGGNPGNDRGSGGKKDRGGSGSSDGPVVEQPPAFTHTEGCEVASQRRSELPGPLLALALALALALLTRRP